MNISRYQQMTREHWASTDNAELIAVAPVVTVVNNGKVQQIERKAPKVALEVVQDSDHVGLSTVWDAPRRQIAPETGTTFVAARAPRSANGWAYVLGTLLAFGAIGLMLAYRG